MRIEHKIHVKTHQSIVQSSLCGIHTSERGGSWLPCESEAHRVFKASLSGICHRWHWSRFKQQLLTQWWGNNGLPIGRFQQDSIAAGGIIGPYYPPVMPFNHFLCHCKTNLSARLYLWLVLCTGIIMGLGLGVSLGNGSMRSIDVWASDLVQSFKTKG